MLAFRAVAEVMGNGELFQEGVGIEMLLAEASGAVAAVADEDESGVGFEFVGLSAEQVFDAVVLEVFVGFKDRLRAVFGRPIHQQRSIPGDRCSEGVGMTEEKRPGTPAGFTETEQQATLGGGLPVVVLLDEGEDDFQEIGFLANEGIGRVVGVPGEM